MDGNYVELKDNDPGSPEALTETELKERSNAVGPSYVSCIFQK